MRHLGNFRKALGLFGAARDLAIETRRYEWELLMPNSFYLEAENADIRFSCHEFSRIQATVELQAGFGWRLATDQDDAGVYMVARRKPLVGALARARITVTLPAEVHLRLKLERCRLSLLDLNAQLEFAPFA